MAAYIAQRLTQGILVLFLTSLLTFLLINLAPGGPASLISFESTAQQREARLRQFGLDQPLHLRYLRWLGSALRGNLGASINQGLPVTSLLRQRLLTTLQLALAALLLTSLFGVLLGALAARYPNRWPDHMVSTISTLGMSVPNFWLGIVAIIFFSVQLRWLPASGSYTIGAPFSLIDRLRHLVLPASVLAFGLMPNIIRVTRTALLEVMNADYVRTAKAKGLSAPNILWKHTLRNALIPITAMLGLITTVLLSGSVVIESVFGWAGLGRLAIEATNGRDYPVILGVTLFVSAIVVCLNLLVDLLYAVIDPRIQYDR
jgi:peptide/nickel transport system permease protein